MKSLYSILKSLLFGLVSVATILLICQKLNSAPTVLRNSAKGVANFTLNGKSYTNAVCTYGPDTVFRNPVAVISAIGIVAATGADSVGIAILNVPDKASWNTAFASGDSTIVNIDQNNQITYHKGYTTGMVTHINGTNFISFSLSNAGGTITKTGAKTFTFSFTTHSPGKTNTDFTVNGSGSF